MDNVRLTATKILYNVAALVAGIVAAWFGASLFKVALLCCGVVFVTELFI